MISFMVSVIIPAYNCENVLSDAVDSVLKQTLQNLEILIIDDCSTDGTLTLAEELAQNDERIRVIRNEANLGVAMTRNRGIDAASFEWIAFLDSDDIWLPEKLEKQIECLFQTGADLCYTGYCCVDIDGKEVGKPHNVPTEINWHRMLSENVVGCSTALFRKPDELRMRPEYFHEDYVLWLELMLNDYIFAGVSEVLMKYRVWDSNRSGNKKNAARNRWLVYRQFLRINVVVAAFYFGVYAVKDLLRRA